MGILKEANTGKRETRAYYRSRIFFSAVFAFVFMVLASGMVLHIFDLNSKDKYTNIIMLITFVLGFLIGYKTVGKWLAKLMNLFDYVIKSK